MVAFEQVPESTCLQAKGVVGAIIGGRQILNTIASASLRFKACSQAILCATRVMRGGASQHALLSGSPCIGNCTASACAHLSRKGLCSSLRNWIVLRQARSRCFLANVSNDAMYCVAALLIEDVSWPTWLVNVAFWGLHRPGSWSLWKQCRYRL
jgi:hypothetical protein